MIEAARQLRANGILPPVCIAIHALFTPDSFALLGEQAASVATCNTVTHKSNAIDVAPVVANSIAALQDLPVV